EPVDLSTEPLFCVARHDHVLPAHLGRQSAVLGADRHQPLAGDVASEHERVRLVRFRRGHELPEAAIRTVDIGREEDAEGPLSRTAAEEEPQAITPAAALASPGAGRSTIATAAAASRSGRSPGPRQGRAPAWPPT